MKEYLIKNSFGILRTAKKSEENITFIFAMENRTEVIQSASVPSSTFSNWLNQPNNSKVSDFMGLKEKSSTFSDATRSNSNYHPQSSPNDIEQLQNSLVNEQLTPETGYLVSNFGTQPDSPSDEIAVHDFSSYNDGEHNELSQVDYEIFGDFNNITSTFGDGETGSNDGEGHFGSSSAFDDDYSTFHLSSYNTDDTIQISSNNTVGYSEEEKIYATLISEFEDLSVPMEHHWQQSWFGCFGSFVEKKMNKLHDPEACQIKFDGASCWPQTPAGTLSTISCFAEFNGLHYDSTREL